MTTFENNIVKQILDHYDGVFGDYLVSICYKYSCDKEYHRTIEVFSYDCDDIIWFNDWYEGQEDVIVDGVVPVSHAYRDHWIVYDIERIFKKRRL